VLDTSFESLVPYGWNDRVLALYNSSARSGEEPARVLRVERTRSTVISLDGRDHSLTVAAPPAVGDWVSVTATAICQVLERWSVLARAAPHGGDVQILAANIDLVLITVPADRIHSARVERELALAWDSGARPLVVLTKADLSPPAEYLGKPVAWVADRLGEHLWSKQRDICDSIVDHRREHEPDALVPVELGVDVGGSENGDQKNEGVEVGRRHRKLVWSDSLLAPTGRHLFGRQGPRTLQNRADWALSAEFGGPKPCRTIVVPQAVTPEADLTVLKVEADDHAGLVGVSSLWCNAAGSISNPEAVYLALGRGVAGTGHWLSPRLGVSTGSGSRC
jgi:hypothetical protein